MKATSLWGGFVSACVVAALVPASATAAEPEKFAVASAEAALSSPQAGAHADMSIGFEFTNDNSEPYALPRDIDVHLPPGAIGNPQVLPRCTPLQMGTGLEDFDCPQEAQVGMTEVTLGGETPGTFREPVYNMTSPGEDVVARLGFFAQLYAVFIGSSPSRPAAMRFLSCRPVKPCHSRRSLAAKNCFSSLSSASYLPTRKRGPRPVWTRRSKFPRTKRPGVVRLRR